MATFEAPNSKLTGLSSDYYKLRIDRPTDGGAPRTVEANDIIEALGLNFAEGNVFKAVWRVAMIRKGGGKPGNTALYDSEKVVFFGHRMVEQNRSAPQEEPSVEAKHAMDVVG